MPDNEILIQLPDSQEDTQLTTIALVGRPNVGKSTLFNRLTRSRTALVTDIAGTTRDRREAIVNHARYRFRLIDTGGMAFSIKEAFSKEIEKQISIAVEQSDLIWFMLDSRAGLNPFDQEMYRWLLRQKKPLMVILNKADTPGRIAHEAEFHALGVDTLFSISASHGSGLDAVMENSITLFPKIATDADLYKEKERPIRVGFLGRPNAGKSSLINKMLGESRMIVSDQAGTTREAIETRFTLKGREYVLVDTAGLKRRSKTHGHLDKLSALNALKAIEQVDVVILVLDASEEAVSQDSKIAREILDHRRACVIALNKTDLLPASKRDRENLRDTEEERLRFISDVDKIQTSAVTGEGISALCEAIDKAAVQFTRKIQTADLNRVLEAIILRAQPPARGRHGTKIFYGTQVRTRPPLFVFYTNNPDSIGDDYTRYMEHQLRFHFGLTGVPIGIQWKSRRDGTSEKRRPVRKKAK